jgi:methylamine--corrinoid protein Co-methyltransferase
VIPFLDVCQRAQTGLQMDERSFDLDRVYQTAGALCAQHGIAYDPDNPVPADDGLADRVYQAAVDFVCETGVFCSDTRRAIEFTRDAVLEALAQSRGRCIMGEGKDRHVFTSRKPDSETRPWFHVGTGIVNTDERIAYNITYANAQLEQANSVSVPALARVNGHDIEPGTPSEIYGAIRSIQIARDALQHAGRSGLAIGNCISTAGTDLAAIAASGPVSRLRPSDGWLVGFLAEMKMRMGTLNKAGYLLHWGANIAGESGPLVGGYAGGPAPTAVLTVAYILAGKVVLHCDYHLTFPIHINRGCSTTRDALWCAALSAQAISRNTREPVWHLGYMAAGPMTRQFFYESAAYNAAVISSGGTTQTCHPAKAVLNDHITPMEMRGSVEQAEACVGMKRTEANMLVKELLARYETDIDDAPMGKRYQDCYDVHTGRPHQAYVDLYGEVKRELASMGFVFKTQGADGCSTC